MNYWVMKGNPASYDWDRNLRGGKEENWHARRFPSSLQANDRVFFWESGPKRRIIAFGVIVKGMFEKDDDGQAVCRVRYLTRRLDWMPGIKLLNQTPFVKAASFLKAGRFGTAYPLKSKQASVLYKLTSAGNPNVDIWPELSGETALPDLDLSASEGRLKLVKHLRRERASQLVAAKKSDFIRQHGKLFCEACGDDLSAYTAIAGEPFEVHHRYPLAKNSKAVNTSLSDLAILCSNCHRVIHRSSPMWSVEKMAKALRRQVSVRRETSGAAWRDGFYSKA